MTYGTSSKLKEDSTARMRSSSSASRLWRKGSRKQNQLLGGCTAALLQSHRQGATAGRRCREPSLLAGGNFSGGKSLVKA